MAEYKKHEDPSCQLEMNTGILTGTLDKIQTWQLL